MATQGLSPHIQNVELGQLFLQARKQCSLSQQEAAVRINGNFSSVHFEWEAQTINNIVRQIEPIEKGDFFVDSEHQHRQQELIHSLAQLYNCSHLEDKYCAELCPIGQSRKQLQYDNIKEVTLSLSASLDYLEDNAKLIGRCIRDDYISDREWPDMLATLQMLKDISHRANFIRRWSGFSPQCIHNDAPEQTRRSKPVNPYAEARKERVVLQSGKEKSMTQETAAAQTNITRSTLASIESNKILPTQSQVIRMSKAYLSPKIRNFYCYHDCPIGGRQDPLDIRDSRGVACMFLSSLLYVGDLNRQLRRLLSDGEIQEYEQKEFQNALNELMDLSSQADTMVLNMIEQLCKNLKMILADQQVSEDELPDFLKTIDYLEKLGYWPEHLEELKETYL